MRGKEECKLQIFGAFALLQFDFLMVFLIYNFLDLTFKNDGSCIEELSQE